jgi:hypothetical protein
VKEYVTAPQVLEGLLGETFEVLTDPNVGSDGYDLARSGLS